MSVRPSGDYMDSKYVFGDCASSVRVSHATNDAVYIRLVFLQNAAGKDAAITKIRQTKSALLDFAIATLRGKILHLLLKFDKIYKVKYGCFDKESYG